MSPYRRESEYPKWNAQRNLSGRTHYVDDDTLRWHKSRILRTVITDGGLIFALIESVALDMNNRKRGFRPVIFDVFGYVIERTKLDESYKTRKQAEKAMWSALNSLDVAGLTLEAIERSTRYHLMEMDQLKALVNKQREEKAA